MIKFLYLKFIYLFVSWLNCQTSIKSIDQIDLLREQQKILSGEVALHSSALKRLSEEAARNPQKDGINVIVLLSYHLNVVDFHWLQKNVVDFCDTFNFMIVL